MDSSQAPSSLCTCVNMLFSGCKLLAKCSRMPKKPFATAKSRMTLFRRALWLASCGRDSAKIAHSITMTITCVAVRSFKMASAIYGAKLTEIMRCRNRFCTWQVILAFW